MPFSNFTDHHLEAFMIGKLIVSPKLILSNNQQLLPNDDTENIPKQLAHDTQRLLWNSKYNKN